MSIGIILLKENDDKMKIDKKVKILYNEWGFDDSECSTGVILLLIETDHEFRILPGKELKKTFNKSNTKRMISDLKYDLRRGNYHKAIITFLNNTEKVLIHGYIPVESDPFQMTAVFIFVIVLVVIACCDFIKTEKEYIKYYLDVIILIKH